MSSYPKWLYHAKEPARIVQSATEHEALGAGWAESPAEFEKPVEVAAVIDPEGPVQHEASAAPDLEALSLEELHALAKEKGLELHPRTGKPKVIAAIQGAQAA